VNIFGVGTSELLMILVIAMLVVGPERMVKLARDAGKAIAKFRQISDSVTKEFRETFSLEELDEQGESGGEGSSTVADGAGVETVVEADAKVVQEAVPALEAGPLEEAPAEVPVSEAAQLEMELASKLVDGEIEVEPLAEMAAPDVQQIAGSPGAFPLLSVEAMSVEVAQLVPEDAEVEPVDIDQAILVIDEAPGDDVADSEG